MNSWYLWFRKQIDQN